MTTILRILGLGLMLCGVVAMGHQGFSAGNATGSVADYWLWMPPLIGGFSLVGGLLLLIATSKTLGDS